MIRTKWLTFLPAILFILGSAYAQDVHYDYDRGADFAAYKTYQWGEDTTVRQNVAAPTGGATISPPSGLPNVQLPDGGPLAVRGGTADDQLIRQDIRRAVNEQLAQKKLTQVESNPDLLVTYRAAVREELGINLSAFGMGSGPLGGWGGSNGGTVSGQTSTIPIGTLVVDLYDPARKQLVWRGDASKTIDIKKDADKNYRNLQKAIAKLFKNYPPISKN